ncbi:hypothetical protein BKA70DRAFT_1189352 [Coprinopsis sp. MPI-PUGE-AT-0042]|nr:hypothetical protein BKA70DRAFT_1189352 [Coprinopsis sp. MPI-PUGE-AT-0042]
MEGESSCSSIRSRGDHTSAGSQSIFHGAGKVTIYGGNFVLGNQHNHGAEKAVQSILEAIPNYRDIHLANLGKATAGTGPCFAEWKQYCRWLVPQDSLKTMWGTGMPGAGKTIFASIAINKAELRAQLNPRICIAYIYFRYSDHSKATVRDFLAVLVKQTIERHPDCLPICFEVYSRHIREKTQPSEAELLCLLHHFSEVLEGMFYFLDALDEAPINIQLDLLEKLSSVKVKLFITSRPLPILEAFFPDAHRYPIFAQDHDLDLHIAKEISLSPVLRSILNQGGPALREKIKTTIKQKCSGMFLHASALQLDALRGCASVYAVERTLEDFPCQIEEVYQQTWKRIKEQSPDMFIVTRSTLIWVLCAVRSLKIEELRHAVATCPATHKFDCRRLVDEATLMGLCRGLVSIEEETNIVRFVHYTAKDIVQGLVSESFPHPDSLPASVCMAILAEPRFQQTTVDDRGRLMDTLETETLVAYAYEHWSTHARKSLDDTTLFGRLSQFIQGCCTFPVGLLGGPRWLVDILEPIHMAAYFDFPLSVVGYGHLCNPNHPTPHKGRTPLTLATWKNSLGAMTELLSLPDILVNAADKDGDIPLTYAMGLRKKGSLSLLLAHPKINVNARNPYGVTALMRVSSEEKAVLLLTHPRIKPNLVNCNGVTALMYASCSGSLKVVKVLLADLRVQVNLKSKAGKTALDMAEEGKFARYHSVDQRRRCEEVAELLRAHLKHEHPQLHPLKVLLCHALPFSRKK